MGIGATTEKEPDYIQDEDLRTPDQLRGDMKNIHKAKLSLNEKATVQACLVEMDVMRQKHEMVHEQLRRVIGMIQTLQGEFNQYKQQRIVELNMKVNGGSTSREDDSGSKH